MKRILMIAALSAALISHAFAVECFPLQTVLEHEAKQGKVLVWSGVGGGSNIPTGMLATPNRGLGLCFSSTQSAKQLAYLATAPAASSMR